jgi:hypothetical protein
MTRDNGLVVIGHSSLLCAIAKVPNDVELHTTSSIFHQTASTNDRCRIRHTTVLKRTFL